MKPRRRAVAWMMAGSKKPKLVKASSGVGAGGVGLVGRADMLGNSRHGRWVSGMGAPDG